MENSATVSSTAGQPLKLMAFTPTLGMAGSERVLVNILSGLNPARFSPTLTTLHRSDSANTYPVPAHISVSTLGIKRARWAIPAILRTVWINKPDIVFSTSNQVNQVMCLAAAFFPPGTRLVIRESSVVSLNFPGLKGFVRRSLTRLLYRFADLIICQGQVMKDDLVHQHRVPAHKLTVVNNPANVTQIRSAASTGPTNWQNAADSIRLVAVGRLDVVKDFALAIQAVKAAREMINQKVTLLIVGEGPERHNLQELIESLGLTGSVSLVGAQDNPFQFIGHADGLLITSQYEGFPNVAIEAVVCGTPIIATPTPGGLAEIISPIEQCITADQRSAQSLATAIATAYRSGFQRISTRQADRFDAARVIRRLENLFDAVVKPHSAPGGPT